MTYRLILSLPVGSSVDALTSAQRAVIGVIHGRWVAGGMPETLPAGGRYLIDVLVDRTVTRETLEALGLPLWLADQHVNREMLDVLGLPLWLIVGCWSWDGVAPAVVTVEPLDTVLYLPHLPDPALLRESHQWAGWPPCIQEESNP